MPDWSYMTVGRHVLACLPAKHARSIVCRMLAIASRPVGGWFIDFLGHLRPQYQRLDRNGDSAIDDWATGAGVPSPVAMHGSLDPDLVAIQAFERFGFGCILIGPLDDDCGADVEVTRDDQNQAIGVPIGGTRISIAQARDRLLKRRLADVQMVLQCQHLDDPAALESQVQQLDGCIDAIIVSLEMAPQASTLDIPALVHFQGGDLQRVSSFCQQKIACGVFVDGSQRDGGQQIFTRRQLPGTRQLTASVREAVGPTPLVIASGGVHEPEDAMKLIADGANIVALESGLVFGGPGLPKRINESCAAQRKLDGGELPANLFHRETWFWTAAMGVAMLLGGLMATIIANTRVLLPYDESLVGMTRDDLLRVNDRLLDFMKHDRMTLAGTMFSVGALYTSLAWCAVRFRTHWAAIAVFISAFAGFVTFFLFLGFGYFDPFHAFVTAILFQFLLLAVHSYRLPDRAMVHVDLRNDDKWRTFLWGQLMFVLHGAILIVAGVTICWVGITSVFVAEDLEFLCTTADKLLSANPQLLPLVAHDRATFGGMLVSCGIVVLLSSMWGMRRGAKWLWWTLLTSGFVAYLMTIWVHHQVGYTDFKHLLPAYGGMAWLLVGSGLTRGYLWDQAAAEI